MTVGTPDTGKEGMQANQIKTHLLKMITRCQATLKDTDVVRQSADALVGY